MQVGDELQEGGGGGGSVGVGRRSVGVCYDWEQLERKGVGEFVESRLMARVASWLVNSAQSPGTPEGRG